MQRLTHILLFLMTCLAMDSVLFASVDEPQLPVSQGESVRIFSDRDFYCIGESIWFSAFITRGEGQVEGAWSKVLYVELINWRGKSMAGMKFPIVEGRASGKILIPGALRSGNYYLKAYTRWLRNYSPYAYAYQPVKIMNHLTREMDEVPGEDSRPDSLFYLEEIPAEHQLELSGLKNSYATREKVELEVELPDDVNKGDLMLTVSRVSVPGNTTAKQVKVLQAPIPHSKDIKYLPELEVSILEGKCLDVNSGKGLEGISLALSSVVDPFYFNISSSGSDGAFIFSLPGTLGEQQFCLQAIEGNNADFELELINDFCQEQLSLPFIPFEITEEEMAVARHMLFAAQLASKYPVVTGLELHSSLPFYGKDRELTLIEDYIEMKDLSEFVFEILPAVSTSKRNGEPGLNLKDAGNYGVFPPLVLMDNVPVANSAELLSIPAKRIQRMERVTGGYIVNEHIFSGIISLYSRGQDMAGMEPGKGAQFFTYRLPEKMKMEPTGLIEKPGEREATFENLLLFKPFCDFAEGKEKIAFYTGDAKGQYKIQVSGIDTSGSRIDFAPVYFEVR